MMNFFSLFLTLFLSSRFFLAPCQCASSQPVSWLKFGIVIPSLPRETPILTPPPPSYTNLFFFIPFSCPLPPNDKWDMQTLFLGGRGGGGGSRGSSCRFPSLSQSLRVPDKARQKHRITGLRVNSMRYTYLLKIHREQWSSFQSLIFWKIFRIHLWLKKIITMIRESSWIAIFKAYVCIETITPLKSAHGFLSYFLLLGLWRSPQQCRLVESAGVWSAISVQRNIPKENGQRPIFEPDQTFVDFSWRARNLRCGEDMGWGFLLEFDRGQLPSHCCWRLCWKLPAVDWWVYGFLPDLIDILGLILLAFLSQ